MSEEMLYFYGDHNIYPEFIDIVLCARGEFDKIKKLVQEGKTFFPTSFYVCVKFGHTELAKYVHTILYDKSTLSKDVSITCKYGNLEIFKYLISLGYVPESNLLEIAAENKNVEIGKYLLSIGFEYTSKITDIAIEKGNIEFLKMLIDFGLKISDQSLQIACKYGRGNILLLLLNLGYELKKVPEHEIFGNYNPIVYRIYHELELPGKYQFRCNAGVCNHCHIVKICKLWQLNSLEYDSYIQFLPRELIDDLETLIKF